MSAATPAVYDVVVIGAGAAGMMCAATAGRRGRRVLLIEHYRLVGEKIRISGGGRCNFTNVHATAANFLSENPHFCRSALARYTPRDFLALVERYRIAWHEKTLGQLFCDGSATQIVDMLRSECAQAGVEWRIPCEVASVERGGDRFTIDTSSGPVRAESLVVATGGLTVPKIGATPFGYRLAEQFAIAVVPPAPALVPLALDPQTMAWLGDLSGVSLDVQASCGEGSFRESMLFTHRGLSGPAILQASSYWRGGEAVHLDLMPGVDAAAWLRDQLHSAARLDNVLAQALPKRLAQPWCATHGAPLPLRELGAARLAAIGALLNDWPLVPSGTLGYNKAEVTRGGVDTRALSSKTMAAIAVPGLYFVGEVLDVTGHLGGFNFQWAWSSGHAAGMAA